LLQLPSNVAKDVWLSAANLFFKVVEIATANKMLDALISSQSGTIGSLPVFGLGELLIKVMVECSSEVPIGCRNALSQLSNSLGKGKYGSQLKLKEFVVMSGSVSDLSEAQRKRRRSDKSGSESSKGRKPFTSTMFIFGAATHHLVDFVAPVEANKKAQNKNEPCTKWERSAKRLRIPDVHMPYPVSISSDANTGWQLLSGLRSKLTNRDVTGDAERRITV